MKLPEATKRALSEGSYDEVEAQWLKRLADSVSELDFFAAVAESLAGAGQASRAQTLLELLDEQLEEQGAWELRLQLIRSCGRHFLKSGRIFDTVLETVRALYADRPQELDVLLPLVGLDRGRDEATKLWDKVERLRNLLVYRVGTIVVMADQGVGVVTEVNLDLQTFKIDFERVKGMAVGFRAAGKLLEPLPAGHVLRRKLEEPHRLAALEPAELLRETLTSYDRPLTSGEIRAILRAVVPDERWTAWWAAARKHPQIVAEGTRRQAYRWAPSSDQARDAAWQAFEAAGLREQLELLRRAVRDDELRSQMVDVVARQARDLATDQPELAFEALLALERASAGPQELEAAELVAGLSDVAAFLRALSSRSAREQAYSLVRQTRADWQAVLEAAFTEEEDPRLLDLLAQAFRQHSEEAYRRLCERASSHSRRTPGAFVWLAERASEEEELRGKRGFKLLRQILTALGDEAFGRQRPRLFALCESGSTVPRLLAGLEEEEARDAVELIKSARGLEPYQREPLITALHLRFPGLEGERETPLYASAATLERKREELRQLVEEELPATRRAIEEARALGDLRENFEYKAARQRHEYLSARAQALHRQLGRAQPLDPKAIDPSQVRIGTRAVLRGSDGEPREIAIMGPWESNPDAGVVSYESEVAQQLLGKRVGDQVELGGETLTVEGILVLELE